MPPEQIEGQRDIDGRADVYSLAATLYHLAAGQIPFPASSAAAIMSRHLTEEPPDIRTVAPHLSEAFSAALRKAMARKRDERTPTALAFAFDLAVPDAGAPAAPPGIAPTGSVSFSTPSRRPSAISSVQSPSGNSTPIPGWDASLLKQFEKELIPLLGPMAKVLVRRAAKQTQNLSEFRQLLAHEIPQEADRCAFIAAGGSGNTPIDQSLLLTLPPSGVRIDTDPRLPAAERILLQEIGPLARVLVRRLAKKAPSWEAFAEEVCTEVPEPSRRSGVRDALLRLSSAG